MAMKIIIIFSTPQKYENIAGWKNMTIIEFFERINECNGGTHRHHRDINRCKAGEKFTDYMELIKH